MANVDILICVLRPPVIEAVRFVGEFEEKLEIGDWLTEVGAPWLPPDERETSGSPGIYWDETFTNLMLRQWAGVTSISDGDWIVDDPAKGLYILTDEVFNATWMEKK